MRMASILVHESCRMNSMVQHDYAFVNVISEVDDSLTTHSISVSYIYKRDYAQTAIHAKLHSKLHGIVRQDNMFLLHTLLYFYS